MPVIIRIGKITIRVYSEKQTKHKLPHCHVCEDGEVSTSVALPTLNVLVGPRLSKESRLLLKENLEKIIQAWEKLN